MRSIRVEHSNHGEDSSHAPLAMMELKNGFSNLKSAQSLSMNPKSRVSSCRQQAKEGLRRCLI